MVSRRLCLYDRNKSHNFYCGRILGVVILYCWRHVHQHWGPVHLAKHVLHNLVLQQYPLYLNQYLLQSSAMAIPLPATSNATHTLSTCHLPFSEILNCASHQLDQHILGKAFWTLCLLLLFMRLDSCCGCLQGQVKLAGEEQEVFRAFCVYSDGLAIMVVVWDQAWFGRQQLWRVDPLSNIFNSNPITPTLWGQRRWLGSQLYHTHEEDTICQHQYQHHHINGGVVSCCWRQGYVNQHNERHEDILVGCEDGTISYISFDTVEVEESN
jgi:uncharacterized protein YodC (DUF2158 family)